MRETDRGARPSSLAIALVLTLVLPGPLRAESPPDTMRRVVPLPGVTVVASRPGTIENAAVTLSGRRLRESLGRTLAETIANEPGVAQRTMGPAPARPVLRGLSGNRLLVLEDGGSTGDLSATAADHAVVIEPLHSRSVEVVRGPAALMFGSNVLAGAIDVRRDLVPSERPDRVSGAWSAQGETVHRGGASALRLAAPVGPLVARVDASARRASDLSTPAGRLRNTSLLAGDGAIGASWIGARGHVGASFGRTSSDYGIPGGFLGGHPKGVDIEMDRTQSIVAGAWRAIRGPFTSVEGDFRWTRYEHRELESSGACGVSFGVLTGDGAVRGHWRGAGAFGPGQVQLAANYRDQAQGCLSFMPPSIERGGSVAAYQEWDRSRWSVRAAARFDARAVSPASRDSNKAGRIRPRRFQGGAAALSAGFAASPEWTLGVSMIRTFMPPSVEELFSEGPHLAAYAYEIGNADLAAERGLGAEAQLRWNRGGTSAALSAFHDHVDAFLHPRATGALEVGPGEEGLLERWQYTGLDVALSGGELTLAHTWSRGLGAEGAASWVMGARRRDGSALPMMPPASARVSLRGSRRAWTAAASVRGALAQHRVAEFEAPTAAWCVADLQLEWNATRARSYTALVATLENVGNVEYRQHLSRVRSVMPEPGRNLKLLLRVQW